MEAKLVVVGGRAKRASVVLKVPKVIGRSKEAGLTIGHPMVSRRHCEVFETDGLLMVRDLGSLNGTVVGGQRVKQSPLPPDAEFSIGPLTFRVEYKYDGDLARLPTAIPAEPEAVAAAAPSSPAEDDDVFDLKDDVAAVPASDSAASPAEADSAFSEKIAANSGDGAAATGKKIAPEPAVAPADTPDDEDIDFFALIEEDSEPTPQPKAAKVAPKHAKPAAAAQPAAAKTTVTSGPKTSTGKQPATAAQPKQTKPAPAAKKQPAKEVAAQSKAIPGADPSELPDDLFDDLLKGLD